MKARVNVARAFLRSRRQHSAPAFRQNPAK